MRGFPQTRTDGLIVEKLDDGLVIYDIETSQAHALGGPPARVWSAANGRRSLEQIGAVAYVDEAGVIAALDQLQARGLLVYDPGVSRRSILKRTAALGGAALLGAPVIDTILIPTAAAHASGGQTQTVTPPPAPTLYTIVITGVFFETLTWKFTSSAGASSNGNLPFLTTLYWDSSGNAGPSNTNAIFSNTYRAPESITSIIIGSRLVPSNVPFTGTFVDATHPSYSDSWSGNNSGGTYAGPAVTGYYSGSPGFAAPDGDSITLTWNFSA